MPGLYNSFSLYNQLLVKFFTRPETYKFYLNIRIKFFPGKTDHIPGHIYYFDRRPHFKDKNLTTFAHGKCLKYELGGFFNNHKKTGYFRMRNSQGTALFDLMAKQWDYRPRRTNHIPKTHRNKLSRTGRIKLHDLFSNAF